MNFRIVNRISTDIVRAAVVQDFLAGRVEMVQVASMFRVGRYTKGNIGLQLFEAGFKIGMLNLERHATADNFRLLK